MTVVPTYRIVIVDGDKARRERVCDLVRSLGIAATAHETASQYDPQGEPAALFLIADEKRALQSMTIFLSRADYPVAMIAYRPLPAVHDVVEAMKLGVMDYLAWPFEPSALLQRLSALGHRNAAVMREMGESASAAARSAPSKTSRSAAAKARNRPSGAGLLNTLTRSMRRRRGPPAR